MLILRWQNDVPLRLHVLFQVRSGGRHFTGQWRDAALGFGDWRQPKMYQRVLEELEGGQIWTDYEWYNIKYLNKCGILLFMPKCPHSCHCFLERNWSHYLNWSIYRDAEADGWFAKPASDSRLYDYVASNFEVVFIISNTIYLNYFDLIGFFWDILRTPLNCFRPHLTSRQS